ncbi:hypothetical protein GGS24DRAFT_190656 [Hypoxylon argillaceum]|nr:hypothetical protein GGS24DRAFT_190656 [Hypoxylon argillaceum]
MAEPKRPPMPAYRPTRRTVVPGGAGSLFERSDPRSTRRSAWTTPKRMIWTGAFAAVTIVGAIYGAGLKTQQEYHAKILETPVEERIQVLEARRSHLMSQKRPLEQKLEELRLRVEKQKQEESAGTTDSRS